MEKEFCIMPESNIYLTHRVGNLERHEVFYGGKNRKKSIKDGLVVFITPDQHRGTYGVHGKNGHEFDLELKRIGERAWIKYYNKTVEEFIREYGKNYL